MVGRGVAREAEETEAAGSCFAQLLKAHGTPFEGRLALHAKRAEQVIRCLRRARERARENLRVGDQRALAPRDRVASELLPDLQIFRPDLRFERSWLAIRVIGMDAVDADDASYTRVIGRRPEDLAHCAATGAPAAE